MWCLKNECVKGDEYKFDARDQNTLRFTMLNTAKNIPSIYSCLCYEHYMYQKQQSCLMGKRQCSLPGLLNTFASCWCGIHRRKEPTEVKVTVIQIRNLHHYCISTKWKSTKHLKWHRPLTFRKSSKSNADCKNMDSCVLCLTPRKFKASSKILTKWPLK